MNISKLIKRFSDLEKHSREVNLPIDLIHDFTKEYIKKQKWNVINETTSKDTITILSENPTFSFWKYFLQGDFQSIKWEIIKEKGLSRVNIYQFFNQRYDQIYWKKIKFGLLKLSLLAILLGIVGLLSDIPAFFPLLVIFLLFLKEYFLNRPAYTFDSFFSSMGEISQTPTNILSYGTPPYFLIHLLFLWIPFVAFLLLLMSVDRFMFYTLAMIAVLLSLIFTVVACILIIPKTFNIVKIFFLFTLDIGFCFFFFYLVPTLAIKVYQFPDRSQLKLHVGTYVIALFVLITATYFIFRQINRLASLKNLIQERKKIFNIETIDFSKHNIRIIKRALVFLWLFFSYFILRGIFYSLLSVKSLFLRENMNNFPPKDIIFLLSLWSIPFIFILLAYFYRFANQVYNIFKQRKTQKIPHHIREAINVICKDLNVKKPFVICDDSPFAYSRIYTDIAFFPVLKVSKGLLEFLNSDEVFGVLVHEMFHLKRHYSWFSFFEFLCIITMVGRNFVTFFLNSINAEFEADNKAQNYLIEKGKREALLSDALRQIQITNTSIEVLRTSSLHSKLSILSFEWSDDLSDKMRFKDKFLIFLGIYFGDYDIGYIHPSLERRAGILKENFVQK